MLMMQQVSEIPHTELLPQPPSEFIALPWLDIAGASDDGLILLHQYFQQCYPGLDLKGQAYFSIQLLSYQIATLFALADLKLGAGLVIDAKQLELKLDQDFSSKEMPAISLLGRPAQRMGLNAVSLAKQTHDQLVELLGPLVEKQYKLCGVTPSALWQTISEAVASAWLEAGYLLKDINGAEQDFARMQQIPQSKFNNLRANY